MVFFPKNSSIVGLELTKESLKKASVRHHKAGWIIISLQEIPFSNLKDDQNSLQKEIKNSFTISNLEAKDLLIRSIEVPLVKKEDILAALPFQAEIVLPYPLENAVLESQIISTEEERTFLTLFAIKKDHLRNHLESYQNISIDPEAVSTTPVALASLFHVINQSEEAQSVLHFGDFQTYLVLMKKGIVLSCRSFDFGLNTFAAAFSSKEDSLQIGLEKFKTMNHQALTEYLPEAFSLMEVIYKELYKSIFALNQKIAFDTLHILGGGIENESWKEQLAKKLEKKIIITKANAILPVSQENLHRFAIPIGLAISSQSSISTNFRRAEFAYPKPLKRYKKPLLTYFFLIIMLSCGLFFFNQTYQTFRLVQLKQDYLHLLAAIGNTFEEIESEFKKENITPSTLLNLSKSGLEERIQKIQFRTLKEPDLFPLFAETPRVSDLLAWLSTHPQVIGGIEANEGTSSLNFDEIHYSMVKKPELSKKKEHYLVKIDLEFSASNPSVARAFHDALLVPNPFVDNKHEVEWSCYKNKYRASFYLKDFTRYY